MLKLPKGQKIKESKQSKPTNYRNNVKKKKYIYIYIYVTIVLPLK